jgi:serine/threonine-protein kinase
MTELSHQLTQALRGTHRLEGELGRGGMSRVFLATELALERRVVIKVLDSRVGAEVNVERFRQEIQVSAALQHPNIIPLLTAGTLDDLPYYIMPYVEGRTLYDVMTEGRPPLRRAVSILRDIARALAAAHSRGVIHRDIKPDNVLLAEGAAMVADFGVAKAVTSARTASEEAPHAGLTSVGMSLGTPAYMAPEQAAADPATDYRADLYAFGVVAYELLSGRHPFDGDSPQSYIVAHLTAVPALLTEVAPDVPPALADLVMQCLHKDPANRPGSAEVVLAGLEDPALLSAEGTRISGVQEGASASSYPAVRRAAWLAAGIVVTLAVAFAAGSRNDGRETSVPPGPSVAVLPFTVIGGDTSDSYFAEGMADELTATLARVPGLRVASRTAAHTVHARGLPVGELGEALHVATLLEGSIRREGNQLRVSVSLIDADDGLTRWSERYQREMRDVFDVQDDITRAIVAALEIELGEGTAPVTVRHGTADLTAYDLYLRGRYFFHQREAASLQKALVFFQEAAATDPDYPLAYSGMADIYGILPLYAPTGNTDSVIALGMSAASRAIALDSTLAEAFASRGVLGTASWHWADAASDFRRAVALRPDYATAHQWYGETLLVEGKVEEAIGSLERATQLDPVSPIMLASYGVALGVGRRDSLALAVARRAVGMDTTLPVTSMMLGTVHLYGGRWAEAIQELERARSLLPGQALIEGLLGYAYARAGRRDEAIALMAAIDPESSGGTPALARIQLGLGDPVQALAALLDAARRRDAFFGSESMASPLWDGVRSLPEFAELVETLGLDPEALAR